MLRNSSLFRVHTVNFCLPHFLFYWATVCCIFVHLFCFSLWMNSTNCLLFTICFSSYNVCMCVCVCVFQDFGQQWRNWSWWCRTWSTPLLWRSEQWTMEFNFSTSSISFLHERSYFWIRYVYIFAPTCFHIHAHLTCVYKRNLLYKLDLKWHLIKFHELVHNFN